MGHLELCEEYKDACIVNLKHSAGINLNFPSGIFNISSRRKTLELYWRSLVVWGWGGHVFYINHVLEVLKAENETN